MDVKWAEKQLLTDEECVEYAPALERLMNSPEWGLMQELMKYARTQAREAGFEGSKDDFEFWKGYIEGLKTLEDYPGRIVARARQLADVEEARTVRIGPSLMRTGDEDVSF